MGRTIVIPGKEQPPIRRWRNRLALMREAVRGIWQGPMQSSEAALAQWLNGTGPVAAGVHVSASTALGVSAFYCAVATISQDVASLPLFLFKSLPSGGAMRFTDHPLNRILHDQANPEGTAFQFRATFMLNVLMHGNAYAEIQRDQIGRPSALWSITPDRVTPSRDRDGRLVYVVRGGTGGDVRIPASDMLHLRGVSPDGILGLDVVTLARETIGLAIASERFGATFFGNGSQLGGVLSPGAGLSEPAQNNLRKALDARHRGVDNAHKWLLAPSGSTFTPVGVSPRDGQVVEVRVHQVREVARFFRIPVSYLGDLERATYSNFEQQQMQYFTNCIRPWLVALEQELNSKLVAGSEKNVQFCEHVTSGFLRADADKRSAMYAVMLQNGAMTVNEVRQLEIYRRFPGDQGEVPQYELQNRAVETNVTDDGGMMIEPKTEPNRDHPQNPVIRCVYLSDMGKHGARVCPWCVRAGI